MADIYDEAEAVKHTLMAVDALLTFQSAPLQLTNLEISDLLIAALSRWKTRAPRHTFELALPGHEPPLLAASDRVEVALDALIAWMVTISPGGDVRVGLRYATPEDALSLGLAAGDAIVTVHATLRPDAVVPNDLDKMAADTAIHLILARAVAAAHGGRLWVTLAPDASALTLGLALPATPPVSATSDAGEALDAESDTDSPGVAAGPSLPLARQRQVALVAHGDPRLARYLRANLERAGFRSLTAADLTGALRLIDAEEPDVTLLDATLPSTSGHDPLQRTLARTAAPIILLTDTANPARAASALDAGAADVIAMPLSVEETLARIRRALRSVANAQHSASRGGVITCGAMTLDESERRVTLSGQMIPLSKTEYRLLRALARHVGKTVTHEALLEQVWGPAYQQEIEFIWVYIRRLRRKIEPDPARPQYIQTAPGVGYMLTAPTASLVSGV
jgi:two-component system KDP operon response regulator KdpE